MISQKLSFIKRRYKVILSSFFLIFFSKVILANNLYLSQIEVDNRTSYVLNLAQKDAFVDILIKVTGQKNITQNPKIKNALDDYSSYIHRFSYRDINDKTYALISFNENKVNNLLKQSNATLWQNRPKLLVWFSPSHIASNLVLRNLQQNNMLEQIKNDLKDDADQRGLDLFYPVYNSYDRNELSIQDIREKNYNNFALASSRYQADVFALVNSRRSGTNIILNFNIYDVKKILSSDTSGKALLTSFNLQTNSNDLSADLADALGDEMSSVYALSFTKEHQTVSLEVQNLNQQKDIISFKKRLEKIDLLNDIKLVNITKNKSSYEVSAQINAKDILNILTKISNLDLVSTNISQTNTLNLDEHELQTINNAIFRWR